MLEIAKGRIWSGEDAKELGLVDELGGFTTALELAREAAGIDDDASLRLKLYPRPKTPFEAFTDKGRDSSEPVRLVAVAFEQLRPVVHLAQRLGLVETPPQTLAMPEMEVVH